MLVTVKVDWMSLGATLRGLMRRNAPLLLWVFALTVPGESRACKCAGEELPSFLDVVARASVTVVAEVVAQHRTGEEVRSPAYVEVRALRVLRGKLRREVLRLTWSSCSPPFNLLTPGSKWVFALRTRPPSVTAQYEASFGKGAEYLSLAGKCAPGLLPLEGATVRAYEQQAIGGPWLASVPLAELEAKIRSMPP